MLFFLVASVALAQPTPPEPVDTHLIGDGPLGYLGAARTSEDVVELLERHHLRQQPRAKSDGRGTSRYAARGLCVQFDDAGSSDFTVSRLDFSTGRATGACPNGDYADPPPFGVTFGMSRADAQAKLGTPWTSDTVACDGVFNDSWMTATNAVVSLSFMNDALFAVGVEGSGDIDTQTWLAEHGGAGLLGGSPAAGADPAPAPVAVETTASPPDEAAEQRARDLIELLYFLVPRVGSAEGVLTAIGVPGHPTWIRLRLDDPAIEATFASPDTLGLSPALVGRRLKVSWGATPQPVMNEPMIWSTLVDPAQPRPVAQTQPVAPASAPPKPFSLLDALLEEEEEARASAQYQTSTESDVPRMPPRAGPPNEPAFCKALFTVIDDYGDLFAHVRGEPATKEESDRVSDYRLAQPIPGFEQQFVFGTSFWRAYDTYEGTIRSNLDRVAASRLFDATAQQILDCTGPPKEPKHGLAFVGVLQAREALPTIDYMCVGIEDDRLPYSYKNFDMKLVTVPSKGDTTGSRFDVRLEMHSR